MHDEYRNLALMFWRHYAFSLTINRPFPIAVAEEVLFPKTGVVGVHARLLLSTVLERIHEAVRQA
jgi:hypothetical protein